MKKELKLQAWVDGEMTDAEAIRVAEWAARDAEAGRIAVELRGVKTAMSGAELSRRVPETREFYWSKIEREIGLEGRPIATRVFWRRRWRWIWPSLIGAAAVACVALMMLRQTPGEEENDEADFTDGALQTVTYHDQAAGLTVIWLEDRVANPRPVQSATD